MLDWLGYNVTCSVAFHDAECNVDGVEGYQDHAIAFLKNIGAAPVAGTNNHVLSGLIPIILNMIIGKLKKTKIRASSVKLMMRTIQGILAGMLSLAFWFDKQNKISSMLLGTNYSDEHADWIKWATYVFTGWWCCSRILLWAVSFRWKKFALVPCSLLVIIFLGITSDAEKGGLWRCNLN
eukprot:jgi/Psemu1/306957/fgenesh1_kg.292_\